MATRTKNNTLPKRLAISAAVAATFLAGYGARPAYAGSCAAVLPAGTYTCSGAAGTDVTQNLNSGTNPLIVTTTAGFGIFTTAGNAFDLSNSIGGTSIDFTDPNFSSITGNLTAIRVLNLGTGATSITSNGAVTGGSNNGIYAFNYASSTSLTISTVAVSGGSIGIGAYNFGTGAASITSTGTVTGTNNYGIYARNAASASTLTINSAAVMSNKTGIKTKNAGSGATSITASGTVTGSGDYGIYARNESGATDLTINTVAVTGNNTGIIARNLGTGATSITSTGTVTGTSYFGIYARNDSNATDLTIHTSTAVSGGYAGMYGINYGKGATSITSTGPVTGTSYNGIFARNGSSATDLTINTVDVKGGYTGIRAFNSGTGATSITVSGAVTGGGGKGAGIFNISTNASTITLNAGASVSATSGNAIIDGAGNTSLIMNSGSSVTGTIRLGGGDDAINLAGGDFSGVTSFDGEAGNDRLSFAGSNGVFNQTLMANIESVTIDNGSTMGLSFTGNAFNATALTGSALIVQNGGILNASNGFALTGNLVNSTGVVSLQNSSIDAPASINGNFTGGGQLLLDANFATNTADRLNIAGNVLAGGTRVGVNDISTGPATGNAITLVSVAGTTAAGDFALSAPVVNGAFNYNTLALVGQDWVLQSIAFVPVVPVIPGVPATPATPAYTPFAGSFEALGQSLLSMANLPSLVDRTHNRIGGMNTGANSGDKTAIDTPIWLRFAGGYRDIDSKSSTTGADFNTNHWLAQVGIDFTVADNANGRFVAGINAGYNKADTDIKSTAGKSNLDITGQSLGLSGTWYSVNGVYVDTQLQRSWYDTDLSAGGVGAGKVNGVNGDGYSASIEVGKEIPLSDSLRITPQAQLVYANVDSDNFTGANAEIVKLAKSKSLKARFGTALNKLFTPDGASRGFVVANVIREFDDETQVNVSGTQLSNAVDRYTGELGVGLSHAWVKGTTSYEATAAVTGSSSLNNFGDSKAAQGEVNFKVKF